MLCLQTLRRRILEWRLGRAGKETDGGCKQLAAAGQRVTWVLAMTLMMPALLPVGGGGMRC